MIRYTDSLAHITPPQLEGLPVAHIPGQHTDR